ncbi:MAG: hypothetical protein Ct9H300mP28_22610 [Pseudomonadota bacterium]|nr:MAG: hypothetical protein Ct9H300mP28_22610 [Pseudomonadota bacterium]
MQNPINIGIPGPSTLKTMLRFAKVCGVKASTEVLRKQGFNIGKLMFVNNLTKSFLNFEDTINFHLYPFGGVAKSSDWLIDWHKKF